MWNEKAIQVCENSVICNLASGSQYSIKHLVKFMVFAHFFPFFLHNFVIQTDSRRVLYVLLSYFRTHFRFSLYIYIKSTQTVEGCTYCPRTSLPGTQRYSSRRCRSHWQCRTYCSGSLWCSFGNSQTHRFRYHTWHSLCCSFWSSLIHTFRHHILSEGKKKHKHIFSLCL